MSEAQTTIPPGRVLGPRGGLLNRKGRPKGALDKRTREVREFARGILESEEYREELRARAVNGELAPAVETMLYHYAYGKPQETVAIVDNTQELLEDATPEELKQVAAEILKEAEEAHHQALLTQLPEDVATTH